jgi:hypothetical protein
MQSNNILFSKVIGEAVKSMMNSSFSASTLEWKWCLRENATYLECPIADYSQTSLNLMVGAYNPAT